MSHLALHFLNLVSLRGMWLYRNWDLVTIIFPDTWWGGGYVKSKKGKKRREWRKEVEAHLREFTRLWPDPQTWGRNQVRAWMPYLFQWAARIKTNSTVTRLQKAVSLFQGLLSGRLRCCCNPRSLPGLERVRQGRGMSEPEGGARGKNGLQS